MLKLGDGMKLVAMYHDVYVVVYVERIIWGPDIALLSNGKWYHMNRGLNQAREQYITDELAGDFTWHSLTVTPRYCDQTEQVKNFLKPDNRPLEKIRPEEIIRL